MATRTLEEHLAEIRQLRGRLTVLRSSQVALSAGRDAAIRAALADGYSQGELARALGVHTSLIYKLKRQNSKVSL